MLLFRLTADKYGTHNRLGCICLGSINFYKSLLQIKVITVTVPSQTLSAGYRSNHPYTCPDGYLPIGALYVGQSEANVSAIISGLHTVRVFNSDLSSRTIGGTIYLYFLPYATSANG